MGLIHDVPNLIRTNTKRWLTHLRYYYGLKCEYYYPIVATGSFYRTEDSGCEYDPDPAETEIDVVVGKGILGQRFGSDASLDMFNNPDGDTAVLLPYDRTLPKDTRVKVFLGMETASGSLFQEFRVERIESVYVASGSVINKAILWPFEAQEVVE